MTLISASIENGWMLDGWTTTIIIKRITVIITVIIIIIIIVILSSRICIVGHNKTSHDLQKPAAHEAQSSGEEVITMIPGKGILI